ncbi:hypothetical protein OIU79_025347 [Salix purpurea]|uniref:Uncharacterized protein n=1 Tax=Salix purpurea TaxID=77065 RepID=A0A9Q1A7A7_SALPP|nr:hypothetical protein OIU79_025347 [Salix purpurea]
MKCYKVKLHLIMRVTWRKPLPAEAPTSKDLVTIKIFEKPHSCILFAFANLDYHLLKNVKVLRPSPLLLNYNSSILPLCKFCLPLSKPQNYNISSLYLPQTLNLWIGASA